MPDLVSDLVLDLIQDLGPDLVPTVGPNLVSDVIPNLLHQICYQILAPVHVVGPCAQGPIGPCGLLRGESSSVTAGARTSWNWRLPIRVAPAKMSRGVPANVSRCDI